MADTPLLILAFCTNVLGMAWLALAKPAHWEQARRGATRTPAAARTLQACGSVALGASLLLCLRVDHPSIASLVWVMLLTASALLVAFTLAWRPSWIGLFALPSRRRAPRRGRAPLPERARRRHHRA